MVEGWTILADMAVGSNIRINKILGGGLNWVWIAMPRSGR
jgi:hypothetical protein